MSGARNIIASCAAAAAIVAVFGARAQAETWSAGGEWAALASDQLASQVGDSLTVLIYEDSSASNTAQKGSKKTTHAGGQVATGSSHVDSAQLDLAGSYDGAGQSGRADHMVAQISVVVTNVLANGDLEVAGDQVRDVNGEHTRIRVQGRVRRVDISSANTVLSTRLADARIDYNGAGFVNRAARPGVVGRLFDHLGLF